ncbi:hypothetical protein Trydic_g23415 [Trypoxylus dichotomus]
MIKLLVLFFNDMLMATIPLKKKITKRKEAHPWRCCGKRQKSFDVTNLFTNVLTEADRDTTLDERTSLSEEAFQVDGNRLSSVIGPE